MYRMECPSGHLYESENGYSPCPVCHQMGTRMDSLETKPQEDDGDSSLALGAAVGSLFSSDDTSSSIPDAGGFSGFGGGDSGGAGASDSFDSGSSDTGTCDASGS